MHLIAKWLGADIAAVPRVRKCLARFKPAIAANETV